MTNIPQSGSSLWNDNPSEIDLLGFDAVVAPILSAIRDENLVPLTIGVHAKWGGGKSTILGLLATELKQESGVTVVRTNPWEYDDHDDVKGTLIAEVLDELQRDFSDDETVAGKAKDLLKRISWSRVGKVVAKGAITRSLDLDGLADALTPKSQDSPDSMAGFKKAFGELISCLPETNRVVVLVDDLDRCMPPAVTATLEAIKLFLSVKGMVFVLAADQDMVRDAIAMNLGSSGEAKAYAHRYLDKIIQLPVSLPVLPTHEAEAYLGLLLSKSSITDAEFAELVLHVNQRRVQGQRYLLSEVDGLSTSPDEGILRLASQLVHGLQSDKVVNPRELKRFLNAYQVRSEIARTRGVVVRADVLAKLLLLEDRFSADFEQLLNRSDVERKALLEAWSAWAKDESGSTKPEDVSDDSKAWAAADPDISEEPIGPYLTLAASFTNKRQGGRPLDADTANLISELIGQAEAVRRNAVLTVGSIGSTDQQLIVGELFQAARISADPTRAIASLIGIANKLPERSQPVAAGLKANCWKQLDEGAAVDLASSEIPALKALARELAGDTEIDKQVRAAAQQVLGDGS